MFLLLPPAAASTADEAPLEVEVVGEHPDAGATPIRLDADQVAALPGALGDPLRALQGRPGVGRSPYGLGLVMLRATDPTQQGVWLGDVPLPRALHFGGLGTVVDPVLIEGIEVRPGAPPARYGGHLGGAIELVPSLAVPSEAGATYGLDALLGRAAGWAPLGRDTAAGIGVRRSWLDVAVEPILSDDRAWQVPGFQDGHLTLSHEAPNSASWHFWLVASSDRVTAPGRYEASWVRAIGQTSQPVGTSDWRVRVATSVGPDQRQARGASGGPELSGLPIPDAGAEAWERDVSGTLRVVLARPGTDLGVESAVRQHRYGWTRGGDEVDGFVGVRSAGAWAEGSADVGPLALAGGGRVDAVAMDSWSAVTADPRGRARLGVAPGTAMTLEAGRAHQPPEPREIDFGGEGDDSLLPGRSTHVAVGTEQQVGATTLTLTMYRTWLADLVVGRQDVFQFDEPLLPGPFDDEAWRNGGEGRVNGVEAGARTRAGEAFGWVSITVCRSERSIDGGPWMPWAWDQPLGIGAGLSAPLRGPLRAGGRVRAGSGLPYVPVVNAITDVESGDLFPVFDTHRPSRLAPFFSLDLRLDWTTSIGHGRSLTVFADVQNATARANEEVVAWSSDWRTVVPVLGLPLLPTLGLSGTL